jgi:hypothetical protein
LGCVRSNIKDFIENEITLDFIDSISEMSSQYQRSSLVKDQDSVYDIILRLDEDRKVCEHLLKRRKVMESNKVMESDSDDDADKNGRKIQQAWHAKMSPVAQLTRKYEYLNMYYETLIYPKRASSYAARDVSTLLQWLVRQRIFISRKTQNVLNASKMNERGKGGRPGTSEERPWTSEDDRPGTPSGNHPGAPYFTPNMVSGTSMTSTCISIQAGRTVIRCGYLTKAVGGLHNEELLLSVDDTNYGKVTVMYLAGVGIDTSSHCYILRSGDGNVISLEPSKTSTVAGTSINVVFINGRLVTESTPLQHNDILCVGYSFFLRLHIPFIARTLLLVEASIPDVDDIVDSVYSRDSFGLWEQCLLQRTFPVIRDELALIKEEVIYMNRGKVDRYKQLMQNLMLPIEAEAEADDVNLASSDKSGDNLHLSPMEASLDCSSLLRSGCIPDAYLLQISQAIIGVDVVNAWAREMRKDKIGMRFKFKVGDFRRIDHNDTCTSRFDLPGREFLLVVDKDTYVSLLGVVECVGSGGSWSWDLDVFSSRMAYMTDVMFDLKYKCNGELLLLDQLYPPLLDPYIDTMDDELIGVSCLFLGALSYLIDINETLTILSFRGHNSGMLKVHGGAWIDIQSEHPSYINIDKEMNLKEFLGRKMIIKFTFERLISVPVAVSSNLFISFKFYHHSTLYKTLRHHGQSCSPHLNAVIVLEQLITLDFIEYIQIEAINLEVWGRREVRQRTTNIKGSNPFVGELQENSLNIKTKVFASDFISLTLCGLLLIMSLWLRVMRLLSQRPFARKTNSFKICQP